MPLRKHPGQKTVRHLLREIGHDWQSKTGKRTVVQKHVPKSIHDGIEFGWYSSLPYAFMHLTEGSQPASHWAELTGLRVSKESLLLGMRTGAYEQEGQPIVDYWLFKKAAAPVARPHLKSFSQQYGVALRRRHPADYTTSWDPESVDDRAEALLHVDSGTAEQMGVDWPAIVRLKNRLCAIGAERFNWDAPTVRRVLAYEQGRPIPYIS